MSSIYKVTAGESIWDVTLNSCGALAIGNIGDDDYVNNLDAILTANGLTDWTPVLAAGQGIIIPDMVSVDINALKQLQVFPVCNNTVSDLLEKITTIFDILANNWILQTGFWDGNAIWTADGLWNPGP